MKTKKLLKTITLAACFLAFLGLNLKAGAQAYDFYYPDSVSTSGSQLNHGFTLDLYQNCNSGPVNFSSVPVFYTVNGAPPVTGTLTWAPVTSFGNPFCPSVTVGCTPTGPVNFQKSEMKYAFTPKTNISAPGAHHFQTSFGPSIGNFEANNIVGTFPIEPQAFNIVVPGMKNGVPKFVNPPVIFVNSQYPVSYLAGAIDPDGDSLVYRLRPAASNITYVSGLSVTSPIWAPGNTFQLNPLTGVMTFVPIAYNQTAGAGAVANRYIVGVNVDEYRKINGVTTKIGTIQRNVMVNVISSITINPTLNTTYKNVRFAQDSIINVVAGTPVTINFTGTDLDAADILTLTSNISTIFPGATFTTSGQNPVSGQITWTPTSDDVREQPYFFQITTTDNACPYPGWLTYTHGIRVKSVTGLTSDLSKAKLFSVFPNPASQEVNFKIETNKPVQEILIYNVLGKNIDRISLANIHPANQELRWENAFKFGSGTYIAKLITADKTIQTLKFTKLQ